ncbi:hypothetical protein QDW41_gp60 [Microbacterium phage QMacho]|uniref:hypothetical protein n=1 Tax=Microbacterium phage QMacho TaxID=2985325 RepID=UPI00242BCFFB|nr:hypothetical protein QDW41_gp60 [Microbacterium phage QMacho]UYL86717.1 hypothetical protein SEA_QMACHO_60 [Microbacterium phage QMacho]
MTTIEPTPAQIAAFKKAWHKANDAGDIGARTEAGLRAALNPPTEFDLLEPGLYVTANNVSPYGEVNEGAVLMSKHESTGWRIETAVSYQKDDPEARIRAWFDNVGLARIQLAPFRQPAPEAPKPEVYLIDDDGDRWEPVPNTDLWHCVDEPELTDRVQEGVERLAGPVTVYGLD